MPRCFLASLLIITSVSAASADVTLHSLFTDHAVLQRDRAVPVWGTADPGEAVTVAIGDHSATTKADENGKWKVALPAMSAATGLTLTASASNAVTCSDVAIGEVWLCSGQSNMAMTVSRSNDFETEKASADHPGIRMFKVGGSASKQPKQQCPGSWLVCSPDTVGGFSATGYFFGRAVHQDLDVPVGLINSSVGGTPIESWISAEAQRATPGLKKFFAMLDREDAAFDRAKAKTNYDKAVAAWKEKSAAAKAAGKRVPKRPRDPIALHDRKRDVGGLFNGKINPLVPYGIRGAIWYQGEANSVPAKARFYQHHLPALVKDWRSRWNQGDFPFAWVQLPNYTGAGRDWPTVREGMRRSLAVPNTGMAIALDVGDPKDIHPKNKQAIGQRLGMWALGTVYGKSVASSGPLATSVSVDAGKASVTFDHAYDGLRMKGEGWDGFELTADGKQWHPANATIEGQRVIVHSDRVANPTAVRYAWQNNPTATLFNSAELPASPFVLAVE